MKKMSFSERVLRAYAAVMRKLFPVWCVKHKTLKRKYYHGTWGTTHNYEGELFLPGKDAEIKAIEKLHLEQKDLDARYWSMETKIELLKRENFSMLLRIKTEEEFNAVVETGRVDKIIETMRSYTPPRRCLIDLIRNRADHQEIIKGVPSAFDSLQAWEVLDVAEKEPYEGKDAWIIARNLIEAKPNIWVPRFFKELKKIQPSELNHEAMITVADCAVVAKDNKVDISDDISYLMTFHVKTYAVLRSEMAKNYTEKEIAPYVNVLLPNLISKMKSNSFVDFLKGQGCGDEVPEVWAQMLDPLSEDKEAAVWLYLALKNGCGTSIIVNNLVTLRKKVIGKAWQYLVSRIVASASSISDIKKLIEFFNNDEKIQEKLRDNLLEVATSSSEVLKGYFPFDGWKEEQAEEAVRLMARGKCLPTDLSEVSDKLREAAVEELEIQSEIEVLRGGSCGDKEALILQKLHPRTEVYLLTHEYKTLVSYGLTYVQNFCMDDSTFKTVVNTNEDSACGKFEETMKKVIALHAEKWGLSQRNYKDLMQSPYYNGLAPLVKKYVKEQ